MGFEEEAIVAGLRGILRRGRRRGTTWDLKKRPSARDFVGPEEEAIVAGLRGI